MASAPELFTCLSCTIAFLSAEDQRAHYRSDHHRYNMKRRVAGLPPVSAELFNQKVLDRRMETAIMSSAKGSFCEACGKTYTTENAYRSHINSKKHKEMELKAQRAPPRPAPSEEVDSAPVVLSEPAQDVKMAAAAEPIPSGSTLVSADSSEADIEASIDAKIAAARSRLSPNSCLFCTVESEGFAENLTHMSAAHSFFVPDAEYLTDLEGLVAYLGEKIAVGNVCIYCNGRGKEFRTLEATRKHMLDKSHCKIAYDSQDDRLEVSDFYDFSSSYPAELVKKDKGKKKAKIVADAGSGEEWEDMDDGDGDGVDEIVDESDSESSDDDSDSDSDSDSSDLPDNEITYGENMELVLPSGLRIGHRKLRRFYPQTFGRRSGKPEDPNSGAALVKQLLADKNSALVPRKGGYGAYGSGTEVVKARNRGEAREAGRHVREFRDQKRREDFRTKIGFIHNSQKHYRDPLLQ